MPTTQHRLAPLVANPTVPSLYAWAVTVAAPALGGHAGPAARVCAGLAFVACVSGGLLVRRRPVWARRLGIHAFVGFSAATWLLLGARSSAPAVVEGDLLPALLGSLGWAAFAFGWGTVRQLGTVPEEHPAALGGAPLEARGKLPGLAAAASAVALAGAALCLALPWRIERMPHAALGHLLGLMTAGALLVTAGRMAAEPRRSSTRSIPAGRRVHGASTSLGLLGLLVLAGAAKWWWRTR